MALRGLRGKWTRIPRVHDRATTFLCCTGTHTPCYCPRSSSGSQNVLCLPLYNLLALIRKTLSCSITTSLLHQRLLFLKDSISTPTPSPTPNKAEFYHYLDISTIVLIKIQYKHLLANVSFPQTKLFKHKDHLHCCVSSLPHTRIVPGMELVVNKCFKNASQDETGGISVDLWRSLSIFTFYNQTNNLVKLKYQH